MANKRYGPVGYRPFRTDPLLAEGLLAVARPGGELLEATADALFRFATDARGVGQRLEAREKAAAGEAGALAAVNASPQVTVTPGTPGRKGQVRSTRHMSADVRGAIAAAAQKHGVDAGTMMQIAMIESSGNPRAKNPNSSAGGLFQFIDDTAKDYGLADRYDPAQASDAAARLLKDNRDYLRRQLGREPSAGELYLAHQQGAGGAARLLRNPGADAAGIVGKAAIRLNGGTEGMTAGEFSSLWTAKLGDVPATEGSVSVGGAAFRPTGNKAYDQAGAKVYLEKVETAMLSGASQLFDLYGDDPASLRKGFAALKSEFLREHVIAEIAPDFDVAFGRLEQQYMAQAADRQRKKIDEENAADFVERTTTVETELQRKIADFDPAAPGADEAIGRSLAAIDRHYDEAVERGVIAADTAAVKKAASRREAVTGFYLKQASALDAAGVAAMREEMREDFADGGIAGLDGDGWNALNLELASLEKTKRSAQRSAAGKLRKAGDQQAARVAAGFEVDAAEMSRLTLEGGASEEGKAQLVETQAKIAAARTIRAGSARDGETYVADLRKGFGAAPSESQLRTLNFARSQLEAKKNAIAKDPVSYAEQQGLVEATPLLTEAQDPADAAGIVEQRVASADEAARELGAPRRFLKAGEAAALGKAIRADPAAGVALAGAIVSGAGAAAPDLLAEFGADAPMIAQAGAIIAFGGSAQAAEDVVLGHGKGPDGKALKGLKPEAARESFSDVAGDALALAPRDRDRVASAAAAIARKRIADRGLEPDSEDALQIHATAVQEAAGAVFDRGVQFGGFAEYDRPGAFTGSARVYIAPSIRADMFEELIATVSEADLAGLAVKPKAGIGDFGHLAPRPMSLRATLLAGVPVPVHDPASGRRGYAFALGDPAGEDPQFVEGEDGAIFVLDLEALRDRLSARLPGAFR